MCSNRLALTMACALAAAPAVAVDRWESTTANPGDDTRFDTTNELKHGAVQPNHDFDGPTDVDYAIVTVRNRHSYEVRVGGGTAVWFRPIPPPTPNCTVCGTLGVFTVSDAQVADGWADSGVAGFAASSLSARWMASADEQLFARAGSAGQTNVNYDLEFLDTTYRLPRFNNSSTQVTVLIVQNSTVNGIGGTVHFLSEKGAPLHSEPIFLNPHSTVVLNTSAIPALQDTSGSALVAHVAPYGQLSGKAVAVEPATGFTFDTPLEPIPR
jgi:hypothetical protein